jgi:hypothetical protein
MDILGGAETYNEWLVRSNLSLQLSKNRATPDHARSALDCLA